MDRYINGRMTENIHKRKQGGEDMPDMNQADFLSTLQRMHKDSKILFENEEYYNSCYLSGYVLECALKYILLTYGRKSSGERYTLEEIKKFRHNTTKLNQYLSDWLSMAGGIEARFRFDSQTICPHIFIGEGGYPKWDPKYRYGEHPQWNLQDFCQKYICDIDNIFHFISNIVVGGN